MSIVTQPVSQIVNLGGLLHLVVQVSDPTGVHYQWRLNGANVPGATNSTFSVLALLPKDAGSYTVVVSDRFTAITSQSALITLNGLLRLPASDSFAGRGPVLNLLGLTGYSNREATGEPGEPRHAGTPGGKSVWFTWTPLLNGVATFSTAGSSFDTLLAVYTGSSLATLTEVASDDDSDGFYTSKVAFNAVAGTTYIIAVDGAYGASGNIVLNSSLNILSPPLPRITNQPASQVVGPGDSATFSVQASGKNLTYQWYFDDVPLAGATAALLSIPNVTASQVGSYSVKVTSANRSVVSRPASLQISTLDGAVNAKSSAQDKFQDAAAGETSAEPTSEESAGVKMSSGAKSSDVRQQGASAPTRGYSSTQIFSTYAGATQEGEPNHCGTAGGASSWTSLQAAESGVVTMDTDGSNFRTILAVYIGNGNDFSSLVPVACDVGSGRGGTNSLLTFTVTSNTVYYVAVDGEYGAYGTVVLHWNLGVPPAITLQPITQTVAPGAAVTLRANASGHPAPVLLWMSNGACLPGCTNASLTITNFQWTNEGTYQMVASNRMGFVKAIPAQILVNNKPRLDSLASNPGTGMFQMRFVGIANSNYVLYASTNLSDWVPISTNTSSTGVLTFTDPASTTLLQRYYRVLPR